MKERFILLLSFLTLSVIAVASNTRQVEAPISSVVNAFAPQVCKFSIDNPTGTIDKSGKTSSFKVLLSCPQDRDVNVTVSVLVDGYVVANKIVTVWKNSTNSGSVYVTVGNEYIGRRYRMIVE